MKAKDVRKTTEFALANEKASQCPRTLTAIEDKAHRGKSSLATFTTRETRSHLKSEGFRVYSILGFTLITW